MSYESLYWLRELSILMCKTRKSRNESVVWLSCVRLVPYDCLFKLESNILTFFDSSICSWNYISHCYFSKNFMFLCLPQRYSATQYIDEWVKLVAFYNHLKKILLELFLCLYSVFISHNFTTIYIFLFLKIFRWKMLSLAYILNFQRVQNGLILNIIDYSADYWNWR